jgi:hypothetical protein
MSRTYITQKQCEVSQRNDLMPGSSLENTRLEPPSIIKAMMKIIKIRSENYMDKETNVQFSKMVDAVIQMTEEIRE